MSSPLRRAYRGLRSALDGLWQADTHVILRASAAATQPGETDESLEATEQHEFTPAVPELYRATDRRWPGLEHILRGRFDRGLLFYRIHHGDELLATAWIHPRGDRFVDEIGLQIAGLERGVWLRDIYVLPQHRGRGLFARTLSRLVRDYHPDAAELWSDTVVANSASMRAHTRHGFAVVATIKARHLARRWMYRECPSHFGATVTGWRVDRRYFRTGSAFRVFVQAHIA